MMPENVELTSSEILAEAQKYIAGGVVSLNRKVDPSIVFSKAKGSRIYDANGNEYIDYHAAFAPFLLGHNDSRVNEAVIRIMNTAHSLFGSGTNALEVELARLLCQSVPSVRRSL